MEVAVQLQGFHAIAQMRGRHELSPASSHQQPEFFQHSLNRVLLAVIPKDHALGRILAANEIELGWGIFRLAAAEFARDIDKESTFGDRGLKPFAMNGKCATEHFEARFQRRTMKAFVGINFGHYADHSIQYTQRGLYQGRVGARHGIKAARENACSNLLHQQPDVKPPRVVSVRAEVLQQRSRIFPVRKIDGVNHASVSPQGA